MRRLATVLQATGAAIAAVGALGLAMGAWANLPPAAVRAIALALPFVLGGMLLTVGALVGRAATRAAADRPATDRPAGDRPATGVAPELGAGQPPADPVRQRAHVTPDRAR